MTEHRWLDYFTRETYASGRPRTHRGMDADQLQTAIDEYERVAAEANGEEVAGFLLGVAADLREELDLLRTRQELA